MLYVSTITNNGKSHIADSVHSGPESRIITTVCGQAYPEYDLTASEDDSNVCARCSGKVELDPAPAPVVESTPDKAVEKEEVPSKSTK